MRRSIPFLIIVSAYVALRIPWLDKPLEHDEIYNTFMFLNSSPLSGSDEGHEAVYQDQDASWSWSADWTRQIWFHPPLVSTIYYGWIRLFGDGEVSLHLLAFLVGLLGVLAFYRAIALVWDITIAVLLAMAVSSSLSCIFYTTQAVHAGFEFAVLSVSLAGLAVFLVGGSRTALHRLIVVNVIGILTFYHYVIYLVLQTLLLFIFRSKLRVPRWYFPVVTVAVLAFLLHVFLGFANQAYSYDFWERWNPKSLAIAVVTLPCSTLFYKTKTIPAEAYPYIALVPLALIGMGSAIKRRSRVHEENSAFGLLLVVLFVTPFALYQAIALAGVKFGNYRNFFYLLPVYLNLVFIGLKVLLRKPRLNLTASFCVVILLLLSSLRLGTNYWNQDYVERAMLRFCTEDTNKLTLVSCERIRAFPFEYYRQRYGLSEQVLRVPWNSVSLAGRSPTIQQELEEAEQVRCLGGAGDAGFACENRFGAGGAMFELAKAQWHEGEDSVAGVFPGMRRPDRSFWICEYRRVLK